jgi:hypothetical protein
MSSNKTNRHLQSRRRRTGGGNENEVRSGPFLRFCGEPFAASGRWPIVSSEGRGERYGPRLIQEQVSKGISLIFAGLLREDQRAYHDECLRLFTILERKEEFVK